MRILKRTDTEPSDQRYKYILIGALILFGIMIFRFARPYLSGFLGAATLYVIVGGQQRYMTQKLGMRKSISALLIVLEVLFFILIPLTDSLSWLSIPFPAYQSTPN